MAGRKKAPGRSARRAGTRTIVKASVPARPASRSQGKASKSRAQQPVKTSHAAARQPTRTRPKSAGAAQPLDEAEQKTVEYFVECLRLLIDKHESAISGLGPDASWKVRGYAEQARLFERRLLDCARNAGRETRTSYNVLSLLGELAFDNSQLGCDLKEGDFREIRGRGPKPPIFSRTHRDWHIRSACEFVEQWLCDRDDDEQLEAAVRELWAARQTTMPDLIGVMRLKVIGYVQHDANGHQEWELVTWKTVFAATSYAPRLPVDEDVVWTVDPAYAGNDVTRREAAKIVARLRSEQGHGTIRAQTLVADLLGLKLRRVQSIVAAKPA